MKMSTSVGELKDGRGSKSSAHNTSPGLLQKSYEPNGKQRFPSINEYQTANSIYPYSKGESPQSIFNKTPEMGKVNAMRDENIRK